MTQLNSKQARGTLEGLWSLHVPSRFQEKAFFRGVMDVSVILASLCLPAVLILA